MSRYPSVTEVPWFGGKVVCAKCEARGGRIDVRPNWQEAPGTIDDWSGRPAMPSGEECCASVRGSLTARKGWVLNPFTAIRLPNKKEKMQNQ